MGEVTSPETDVDIIAKDIGYRHTMSEMIVDAMLMAAKRYSQP